MKFNDETFEVFFKVWEKEISEDIKIKLSSHIETVLLYLCALTETISDEYLDYINLFAYPKFTKEEIEGIVGIINRYNSDMNYMIPSFFLRMIQSDISKIVNRTAPSIGISNDNGIQISVESNQKLEDEIHLETLNAIFMLTETIAIGFDINSYATPKSEIFLSSFKTFINGLLETYKDSRLYDVLFVPEAKEIILERVNELNFDNHDNNVDILNSEMKDIKDSIEDFGEDLFYKYYLSSYIQMNLIYLWSTNEKVSQEMFQYFNFFREYQFTSKEILEALEIMDGEDYSCIFPFDFMFFMNLDIYNESSQTRYYISFLQMFFMYGVRILNSLSLEAINIIQQSINSLIKLCNNNNVECNETAQAFDKIVRESWGNLYNEIIEKENNNGIYENRKNIIKENVEDIFYNIIYYMIKINCTTEDVVQECLSIHSEFYIEIIEKLFRKCLETIDFDTKIELLKYVQKYVKITYYEGEDSERKIFAQEILDELLNYIIEVQLPKYGTIERIGEDSENVGIFISNNEAIIKDLFEYPSGMWTEQEYYFKRNKAGADYRKRGRLSETMYFLGIILKKAFIENRLTLVDELFDLLYNSNQEYFNKLFNYLIKDLESESEYESRKQNVIWTKEQMDILKKWSNCTIDNKINDLKISHLKLKDNLTSEKQSNYIAETIEIYKTDIVKFEKELIKKLEKIDREQMYPILKSLILAKNEKSNKNDEYGYCFFRIMNSSLFKNEINNKLLYDNFIIDSLIDIAVNTNERDYYTMMIFLSIFDSYIEDNKDNSSAIDFVKKIIDKKSKLAFQFIKEIIFYLKNHTDQTYINNVKEIIDYANAKGIKEIDTMFKKQLKASKIYNDENISMTDYILNISNNISDEEIRACNVRIDKLMAPYNLKKYKIEERFDFEKIIEHIIKNKKIFVHKNYDNIFNYVDWYFNGLISIESEDALNRLIDNKIIYEDISKIIKEYVFGKSIFEQGASSSFVVLGVGIDLRRYIVIAFSKKRNHQKLKSLMQNYVNMIQDKKTKMKMLKTIDIVNCCYNDDYYKTSKSMEQLNDSLKSLGWDLNWDFYRDLYLQFLIKACEKDCEFVAKILLKYIRKGWSVDSIILEIYINCGIKKIEKLLKSDRDFKNHFLKRVDLKSNLIVSTKNISVEDGYVMLKLLIENIDDEKNKYELIKKILYSKNYRAMISPQELEYINSTIKSLKGEKYKKELLHKWELLEKSKRE